MAPEKKPSLPDHPRSLAVLICHDVIENGASLGNAIHYVLKDKTNITPLDRRFIHSLCFGLLRWYWQLDEQLKPLLNRPIKRKEILVKYIILLGLLQIIHLRIPAHAAVADTVKCCQKLKKNWAKNLVNACLRNFIRNNEDYLNQPPSEEFYALANYSHPQWLADKVETAWPEYTKEILRSNNTPAPLCLRVNQQKISRDDYFKVLLEKQIEAEIDPYSDVGIRIQNSLPVNELPNFDRGWVSVQDTASQLIRNMLKVNGSHRVLDSCAAPGGKTSLLIESAGDELEIHALDIDGSRNTKLLDTLSRLNHRAKIIEGDARRPEEWWDKQPYQKILVDAPCSGLGIIRRHPDIKHLRYAEDLGKLLETQQEILNACWNILAVNGQLLYTTCSILPEENVKQIEQFVNSHKNVRVEELSLSNAIKQKFGLQMLPGHSDTDGFYYCLMTKVSE
jgi:16S rRNA (cytosine967-C5)-methyltransferase